MSILDRIKKIRIGGVDFDVRANPELSIAANACGRICVNVSRIEIEPSLSEQAQAQTILHEVLHGIVRLSKLRDVFQDNDDEERAIDGFAHGLLQVIRDNPALIAEIQGLWPQPYSLTLSK
jgi:hypothetical protein